MTIKCTWKDCCDKAENPQIDTHGREWANLCNDHNELLSETVTTGTPPKIISYWIKAKGGAEEAHRQH